MYRKSGDTETSFKDSIYGYPRAQCRKRDGEGKLFFDCLLSIRGFLLFTRMHVCVFVRIARRVRQSSTSFSGYARSTEISIGAYTDIYSCCLYISGRREIELLSDAIIKES